MPESKFSRSSLKLELVKFFKENPHQTFSVKKLCNIFYCNSKKKKEILENVLNLLVTEKFLHKISKKTYVLNVEKALSSLKSPIIEGIVDMKQTGKAYVISEVTEEDVYIAPNNTLNALDGDLVRVQLFPKRPGRKLEGEIIEVIKRKRTRFVGVVSIGRKMGFLTPDDPSIPIDIIIPFEELNGAKDGIKAIAEIVEWDKHARNPFGKIVKVLGQPGNIDVEMDSILTQYEFPLNFEKVTLSEAEKLTDGITEKEIKKRRDFRNIFTITIDPEDAKDFDDAISLQILDNGNFEIGVHIADVSFYVKPNTAIDREAYQRGTSVYLVDRVIPMLPERLSNYLCSLRPNEDKLCFSVVFELDKNAKVLNKWIGKTIINSNIRFNYDEVQKIIEGEPHPYSKEILILHNIASILRKRRFQKGSINFRSKEVKFILDEKGFPIKAFLKEQKEANNLIEEFMLLANRTVTEWVAVELKKTKGLELPFIYRVHDEPPAEKLNNFAEFLKKLGYKLNISDRKKLSFSLNSLLQEISGKAEENMIETIAIRTMAKAIYSEKNIGHYGLGFDYYTHFTSPIRRYPDLMVHRFLDNYLNGKYEHPKLNLTEICKHCSDTEKRATEAERESIKLKQVEFMSKHIGKAFWGVVSGVSKWGIFVEIDEVKAEGLVRMKDLGNDLFYLDDENYCVIGYHTKKCIKLGDPIKVVIKAVDIPRKQIDLKLANLL